MLCMALFRCHVHKHVHKIFVRLGPVYNVEDWYSLLDKT